MELPVISNNAPTAEGGGCASSGCGSAPDALAHVPDYIRAKVQDHPCYSEEAHHYFARMHVADSNVVFSAEGARATENE